MSNHFTPLTIDEAIALLEEHAFTTDEPDREYDGDGADDGGFEAPRRRIVHCFIGGLGADWDLADAIECVRSSRERGWLLNPFRHDLYVELDDGRGRAFAVEMPDRRAALEKLAQETIHGR